MVGRRRGGERRRERERERGAEGEREGERHREGGGVEILFTTSSLLFSNIFLGPNWQRLDKKMSLLSLRKYFTKTFEFLIFDGQLGNYIDDVFQS